MDSLSGFIVDKYININMIHSFYRFKTELCMTSKQLGHSTPVVRGIGSIEACRVFPCPPVCRRSHQRYQGYQLTQKHTAKFLEVLKD